MGRDGAEDSSMSWVLYHAVSGVIESMELMLREGYSTGGLIDRANRKIVCQVRYLGGRVARIEQGSTKCWRQRLRNQISNLQFKSHPLDFRVIPQ